ncbi:hypothetical protein VTO42DRAFT_6638 [Malbranchea cinnamomea]
MVALARAIHLFLNTCSSWPSQTSNTPIKSGKLRTLTQMLLGPSTVLQQDFTISQIKQSPLMCLASNLRETSSDTTFATQYLNRGAR